MAKGLPEKLKERVDRFTVTVRQRLLTIAYASSTDAESWIRPPDSAPPNVENPAHLRRLAYVVSRVIESLALFDDRHLIKFLVDDLDAHDCAKRYTQKRDECIKDQRQSKAMVFTLTDAVRRIRDDQELGPLRLTYLDTELFTACFVLWRYENDLSQYERAKLNDRIWREAQARVNKEKSYHDLSTTWWGIRLLTERHPVISDEAKIDVVRKLLDFSYSGDPGTPPEPSMLLTNEAEYLRSFEHNGDLGSPFRAAVFCHQNAVVIRKWLESRRDPRLSPLIQRLHEWADSCAELCDMNGVTRSGHELYDAALDLAFLAEWWKDRGLSWQRATQILNEGLPEDWAKPSINGLTTTDVNFASLVQEVVHSVQQFRASAGQKYPCVIALFGPPGTGKSTIAKASANENDILEVNLSVLQNHVDLFTTVRNWLKDEGARPKAPLLFLDEFDVRLRGEFWYRWLLSLLWDGKYPVNNGGAIELLPVPMPFTVFLAASRYERYQDFRRDALSPEAKDHKAADLLSRIDMWLDIPGLDARGRALIMNNITGRKATRELLALSFMSEIEDNARGIAKLLKGVDLKQPVSPEVLMPGARARLYRGAGLIGCG